MDPALQLATRPGWAARRGGGLPMLKSQVRQLTRPFLPGKAQAPAREAAPASLVFQL